jgi:xanthine dehydrogenase accessory factor
MSWVEITVLETRGSAPREAGTRMWVALAETRGTIGGGHLEYTAMQIAREMLHSGEERRERRFALGDSLGQCCGGHVTLAFQRKNEIEEEKPTRFHVLLFGAGHVGKEVAAILRRLPCGLTWIDTLQDEAAWAVDEAPAGAFYLVMTHSHALDLEIVERALRRRDYGFVGVIGSQTKAAKFRARLRAKGIDAGDLVCPIGSFKSGKHPAEVAVSAVAQLLQLRQAKMPVGDALESVAGA